MNKEIIISVNPGFNRYNIDLLSIEKAFRQWSDNVINFEDMVCLSSNDYKLTVADTGHLEIFARSVGFLSTTLFDLLVKILPQVYKYISTPDGFYNVKIFWENGLGSEFADEASIVNIISQLPVNNKDCVRTTHLVRSETYCTSFVSRINQ